MWDGDLGAGGGVRSCGIWMGSGGGGVTRERRQGCKGRYSGGGGEDGKGEG